MAQTHYEMTVRLRHGGWRKLWFMLAAHLVLRWPGRRPPTLVVLSRGRASRRRHEMDVMLCSRLTWRPERYHGRPQWVAEVTRDELRSEE